MLDTGALLYVALEDEDRPVGVVEIGYFTGVVELRCEDCLAPLQRGEVVGWLDTGFNFEPKPAYCHLHVLSADEPPYARVGAFGSSEDAWKFLREVRT